MEQHTVRFASEKELRLLRIIAAADGVSVSTWVRDAALEKMKNELPSFLNELQVMLASEEIENIKATETNTLQTD